MDNNLELASGSITQVMKGVAGRNDLWLVPVEMIRVIDGFNVRVKDDGEYWTAVREYADSMKANGFYRDKALAGYVANVNGENVIYVTDGHTRLDAAKLAISEGCALDKLPMLVKPQGTNMEDLTIALYTSNTGRPLRPIEVAEVCKRLIGYNMPEQEIAKRLGLTVVHVSSLLKLLEAPKAVRDMVTSGVVSATLAIEMIKAHGSNAAKVLNEGLTAAFSAGKDKLTKKHIPVSAPAKPKQNTLRVGVSYMREQNLHTDERIIKLMCILTGKKEAAVRKALAAT